MEEDAAWHLIVAIVSIVEIVVMEVNTTTQFKDLGMYLSEDVLEDVKLEGVLGEERLQQDKARSSECEKDVPHLCSTTITTILTPSKTTEHFSDPIRLPQALAR